MKLSLSACAVACLVSLNALCAPAAKPEAPAWPYEYMRGEVEVPCLDDAKESCVWHRLIVDNQSENTLECTGRLAYDGVNREQHATMEHRMVVMPHARKAIVADITNADVKAGSHGVDCVARKPPDNSKLTPNCKPTVLNGPGSLDYPRESRQAGEDGTVLVEFSLTNELAHPTDIVVVGSSLWPRLDESGIKYVAQFNGATDCKHGRFRIPVTFQLR